MEYDRQKDLEAKQRAGSAAPIEGLCGAKLRGTDPPRYCIKPPQPGRPRCRLHGGKVPVGVAHHKFTTGKGSKYFGVLPPHLRKHLDGRAAESIASSRQEIALVDARISSVLESLRARDPVRVATEAKVALRDLKMAIRREDQFEAERLLERLKRHLDETAADAANWREIRECLDTRDKLARTEISYQKLIADRILAEHIDGLIKALITEARSLPIDRETLQRYVRNVELAAVTVLQGALPADAGPDGEG